MSGQRKFLGYLAGIAAFALLIRVVFVAVVSSKFPAYGDSFHFHNLADLIAQGKGFISPDIYLRTGSSVATAEHPPLYTLYLSVFSLFDASLTVQRYATAVIGAGTVFAIGLLGCAVGRQRTGLLAAGLAAIYPLLFVADGTVMSESLYGLLVTLTLWCCYRYLTRPSWGNAAVVGVLIGLAALTRAEAVALLLLLALPLVYRAGTARLRNFTVITATAVLVIAPWAVRNAVEIGGFVPLSTNSGTLIAGANCESTYNGEFLGMWDLRCIPKRTTDNEARQAARWREEGFEYASDHLGRLPTVMTVRFLRVWDLYRPGQQIRFEALEGRDREWETVGIVFYYLLLILAVAGVVVLWRRRETLFILLAPVLLVSLVAVFAYGITRLRFAAEPSLLVLGSVGLLALYDRIRSSKSTTVVPQGSS